MSSGAILMKLRARGLGITLAGLVTLAAAGCQEDNNNPAAFAVKPLPPGAAPVPTAGEMMKKQMNQATYKETLKKSGYPGVK